MIRRRLREIERAQLLADLGALLRCHRGPDAAIKAIRIYCALTGACDVPAKRYDNTRIIRSLVTQLRREAWPVAILGGRAGGYFLARDAAELAPTIEVFHSRALASLTQEKHLRQIPFSDLLEQFELELTQEAHRG